MAHVLQSAKEPELNYFICTLGQAVKINAQGPHVFKTVNDLIDCQARTIPQAPAVGFPVPPDSENNGPEWQQRFLTFEDLRQGSTAIGQYLSKSLRAYTTHTKTVALLCPSSIDFLFAWLGLMRLGHSVLLIAPQCQPAAIALLCTSCNVTGLFYDEMYERLAKASEGASSSASLLRPIRLPGAKQREELLGDITLTGDFMLLRASLLEVKETDVAYLHHTSGTSTGLPKPISQSHRAAVGVLPCLEKGHGKATFTTTPLYHGGIADCFRAWTSNAMIWLFPGKEVPITAQNVLKSLECAQRSTKSFQTPQVTYFSSVPYVLQMVAADNDGLQMLKSMEIAGVGGAALPQEVGDGLVENGVHLVSRFGSAECGFIMSSHRDYATDKEWQFLRSNRSMPLSFEPRDDGLSELVVLAQWPHMAKRNRDDGSFATADLFAPHPIISNAWKYHSRADSQLTLITGKKFDPAPLEAAIATSSLLKDVLIFGNGQQYPGALLFRSLYSQEMSDEQVLGTVWPSIDKLNADSQSHARLSRSMLVVMTRGAPALEKSSKGTILRGVAEKTFHAEINKAYEGVSGLDTNGQREDVGASVADHDVSIVVLEIVTSVLNTKIPIPEDTDLFSFGIDSVACMQIRALLQTRILSPEMPKLPLNVVYDCGTIKRLSRYLLNIRKGQTTEREDEIQLMLDLVQEHGSFSPNLIGTPNNHSSTPAKPIIILTGATGSLGAHILSLLLSHPSAPQITCLVRAATPAAAYARVFKSLLARQLPPLNEDSKLSCLPVKLSEGNLGLSIEDYGNLAENAVTIIHAAWAVNFRASLRSFIKDHILGLRNLITLALSAPRPQPPKFLFCSSTASVISSPSPIKETISHSPHTASPLGYSRSKWVAEAICAKAHAETRMRGRIAVLRVGQLCGDSKRGVWNMSEAWPLMISSVKATGSLPDLQDEALDWLPVDVAAEAVLQVGDIDAPNPPTQSANDDDTDIPVYHILNPHSTPTWSDLLHWLRTTLHPKSFQILPPNQWVQRLETLPYHPATKLIGLWRDAYCGDEGRKAEGGGDENGREGEGGGGDKKEKLVFETQKTSMTVPAIRNVQPIDEALFAKIWAWIEGPGGGGGGEVGV